MTDTLETISGKESLDKVFSKRGYVVSDDFVAARQYVATLEAENKRLREALAWMDNCDPELVEAAKQKFGIADAALQEQDR